MLGGPKDDLAFVTAKSKELAIALKDIKGGRAQKGDVVSKRGVCSISSPAGAVSRINISPKQTKRATKTS